MGIREGGGSSSGAPPAPSSWPPERPTGPDGAVLSEWPAAVTDRVTAQASPSVPPEVLEEELESAPFWDRWYERAVEDDVDPELAELGRRLMREAHLQSWPPPLQRECGLDDEGEIMLELALEDPDGAEARWRELLSR